VSSVGLKVLKNRLDEYNCLAVGGETVVLIIRAILAPREVFEAAVILLGDDCVHSPDILRVRTPAQLREAGK
jgi:hypothetical protein